MSQGDYTNVTDVADYSTYDPYGAIAAALENYTNLSSTGTAGLESSLAALTQSLDPNAALSAFLGQAGGVTDLVSGSTSDLEAQLRALAARNAEAGVQEAGTQFNAMGAGRSGAANRAFGEAYGNAFADVEAQIAEQQLGMTSDLWNQMLSGQYGLQQTGAGAYSNLASLYGSLLGTGASGYGSLASELGGIVAPTYEYDPSDWESFLSSVGTIGETGAGIGSAVAALKVAFVCIHPKSKITLKSGKGKPISRVKPGDKVLDMHGAECFIVGKIKYVERSRYRFFKYECNEGTIYVCDTHRFNSSGPIKAKAPIKTPKYSYDLITSGYKGSYQIDHVPVECMIIETFKSAF